MTNILIRNFHIMKSYHYLMKRSRAGRAAIIEQIYNDPKMGKNIHGWIKQELNSGRTFANVRLPPGFDLAHFPGCENQKGFDYRFTYLQNTSIHQNRHKIDNNGFKNKTPTNITIKIGKDTPAFGSYSKMYEYYQNSNSLIQENKPNTKISTNQTKPMKIHAGKLLNRACVGLNIVDISSSIISGDTKGAVIKSSGFIGGCAGQYIGAIIGSVGGPVGILIGGYVGGFIGDYLGSKAAEAAFDSCIESAGLVDNDGKTGGVEIRNIISLYPLKCNAIFLFSQINLIAFQLNSEIPNIFQKLLPEVEMDFIVHRIIYEIYYGIVVHNAPILFSLHFAKEGFLYPVMHPYYRNTLTGYILGFLDYFLKGFVNGGIYKPEFLLEWDKTKNMNADYLRQNIVDIREELKKNNLQSIGYLSLRELYDSNDDDDDNDDNEKNKKQKYYSAFRILGKTNKVQICGKYIIPECDFDVEHDLNPSAEVEAELSKYNETKYHQEQKEMEKAYQRMHDQIHKKMKQIPMFASWFELLKIVSFGAHYVQTLIEAGIQPFIPEQILLKPFPTAMPPIPIRQTKTFHIGLSFYDFIQQLSPQIIKKIDDNMYKIINEKLYDFSLINEILFNESRRIIKQKLATQISIQQIEKREDSELQIQLINLRI